MDGEAHDPPDCQLSGPSLPRPKFLKLVAPAGSSGDCDESPSLGDAGQEALTKACMALRSSLRQEAERMMERHEKHFEEFLNGVSRTRLPSQQFVRPSWTSTSLDAPKRKGQKTAVNSHADNGANGARVSARRSNTAQSVGSVQSDGNGVASTPTTPDTTRDERAVSAVASFASGGLGHLAKMMKLEQEQEVRTFGRSLFNIRQWWKNLMEPPRHGRLAVLVRSKTFETLCMLIIFFNGVCIVAMTNVTMSDLSKDRSDLDAIMEAPFLIFYSIELTLKFAVHRWYLFVNDDAPWNNMDTILVASGLAGIFMDRVVQVDSIGNSSFMRILRFFKVTRILRMVRALKFVSELRLMLVCLMGSLLALFWVLLLMAFLLILFSIFFVQGFAIYLQENVISDADKDEILQMFGSVQLGSLTLFQCVTGGQEWDVPYLIAERLGFAYQAAFVFFVGFFMIAVWNVVTSLFLEKAMQLARPDVETLMLEQNRKNLNDSNELMAICRKMRKEYGASNDRYISMDQLMQMWDEPMFRLFFDVRNIDIKDVGMFYKLLSKSAEAGQVELEHFVEGCMTLKGTASSIDLHTVRFEIQKMHGSLRDLQMFFADGEGKTALLLSPSSTGLGAPPAGSAN